MQWPNCGIALGQNWDGIDDIFNIKVVGQNYDGKGPCVVFEEEYL